MIDAYVCFAIACFIASWVVDEFEASRHEKIERARIERLEAQVTQTCGKNGFRT